MIADEFRLIIKNKLLIHSCIPSAKVNNTEFIRLFLCP